VLVGDRPRLQADELPAELCELAHLQYVRIRHRHQHQDIHHLADILRAQVPTLAERAGDRAKITPETTPQVDLTGAKAVQIGDHNVQHNQFS
jgi:hypothetical protein